MFGRRYTVNGHKLENIFDGNVSFFYSRQFTDDSWTRFSVSLLPKVHKSVGIGRACAANVSKATLNYEL